METKVTKVYPNGNMEHSIYSNDLSSKENLITEIIMQVNHNGNVLDERLRRLADNMITESGNHYMYEDGQGNVYMTRK